MSLWTASQAQAATQGRLVGPADWWAHGVSIDSRTVVTGDLFIALAGPHHDGHDHVRAAIAAGAVAALVHRIPEGGEDLPLLVVPDSMRGLEDLGRAARERSNARIIAVTGSVGKTSTKEILARSLADQGLTHWSVGSFNNHWGVPLSLARMPQDAMFGVFELGMNHPGEITPLTALVRPHVAIITTIELVHSAFFHDTAEIAAAKAEIFAGLDRDGVAVLNRDNRHFHQLSEAARKAGIDDIRTFGTHIDADARLLDVAVETDHTRVFAMLDDESVSFRIGISGKQWAMNALAALLAVKAVGASPRHAMQKLAEMSAPKGRGERHRAAIGTGFIDVIDESYNASPVSTRAAIAALAAVTLARGARRIAILGDMLELGEASPALHAGLAEAIAEWNIDLVYTAGPLMAHLRDALPPERRGAHADDANALAPLVKAAVRPGDVVMVKGSAGSRMGRIVKALLHGGEGRDAL